MIKGPNRLIKLILAVSALSLSLQLFAQDRSTISTGYGSKVVFTWDGKTLYNEAQNPILKNSVNFFQEAGNNFGVDDRIFNWDGKNVRKGQLKSNEVLYSFDGNYIKEGQSGAIVLTVDGNYIRERMDGSVVYTIQGKVPTEIIIYAILLSQSLRTNTESPSNVAGVSASNNDPNYESTAVDNTLWFSQIQLGLGAQSTPNGVFAGLHTQLYFVGQKMLNNSGELRLNSKFNILAAYDFLFQIEVTVQQIYTSNWSIEAGITQGIPIETSSSGGFGMIGQIGKYYPTKGERARLFAARIYTHRGTRDDIGGTQQTYTNVGFQVVLGYKFR